LGTILVNDNHVSIKAERRNTERGTERQTDRGTEQSYVLTRDNATSTGNTAAVGARTSSNGQSNFIYNMKRKFTSKINPKNILTKDDIKEQGQKKLTCMIITNFLAFVI
jgi:hypothetical protein